MNPILKIHSDLGAQGWHLLDMPAEHPPKACGLYERRGERAWLVRSGGSFQLEPVVEPAPSRRESA